MKIDFIGIISSSIQWLLLLLYMLRPLYIVIRIIIVVVPSHASPCIYVIKPNPPHRPSLNSTSLSNHTCIILTNICSINITNIVRKAWSHLSPNQSVNIKPIQITHSTCTIEASKDVKG